jgi:hypothetical protein
MNTLQQPPGGDDNDGFSPSLLNVSDRLIRGNLAGWNDQSKWHDRDGLPLPSPMLVGGVNTALQRWQNQRPEIILAKPLPDSDTLNGTIPQSEWELDLNGKPRPPWQLVFAIYLLNLTTGTIYTYLNGTVGARICYEALQESVCIMRALRGSKVLPLVNLEQRPMKTSYGPRSRPHLEIIDWRSPGSDGGGLLLSPQRPDSQLTGPTPAPAAAATLDAMKPVKPTTVAETIADELPPWA